MVSSRRSAAVEADVPVDAGELDYCSMLPFLEAVRLPVHPSPGQALPRESRAYLLLRYRIQVATVVVLKTGLREMRSSRDVAA